MIILTRSALSVVSVAKVFLLLVNVVVIHWYKRNNWLLYLSLGLVVLGSLGQLYRVKKYEKFA